MIDGRMDFDIKIIEKTADGRLVIEFIPRPERYSIKEINGVEGYWDKFDEKFISFNVFAEAVENMGNLPVFYRENPIKDVKRYTKERIDYLNLNLENNMEKYQYYDESEEFLDSLKEVTLRFVILSIDIVGSTKMSQKLSLEDNAKVIQLYSSEVSQLIKCFGGYVLKFQGDGILAYFPEPSYIGMNDSAIECAHAIKYFIINGLNSILNCKGLPSIGVRIGLDSGEAMIMIIGSKATKIQKDLIGKTINLASKIQSLADPNQILAGEATIRNAYFRYREMFDKKELPDTWNYYKSDEEGGEKYSVFAYKY